MTSRLVAFAAFLLAALAAPLAAQEFMALTEPVVLDPADPQADTVGDLKFLGALEIEPDQESIGGISSLEWFDGKLYGVLDDGRWIVLQPDELDGKLIDISTVELGDLTDTKGKRIKRKDDADAEALVRTADGEWLVAFEQDHRIWRYATLDSEAAATDLQIVELVAGAKANGGIKTLALSPAGLLACGEWAGSDTPNCIRQRGGDLEKFEVAPPAGIAERGGVPTDASCASDGTCYILFRSYSSSEGNAAAIVSLAPDNTATTLAVLLPPLTLDNFEGLAVREQYGRTFLYIASDNNFSDSQRTLLMKFEVPSARKDVVLPPPPSTAVDTTKYATVSIVLETELGDITIALETQRAPMTAANFLRYVDEGRFDGTVFYRAMRLEREPMPNGLIQGGTQWDPKRVLPGIPHEPTSQTGLSHTSGAISMAMGEPGTANGDFSIMLQDQTGLDATPGSDDPVFRNGYAVFGYVTDGMDVVTAIHSAPVDPNKGEGWMKGQMLAKPVKIVRARRAD